MALVERRGSGQDVAMWIDAKGSDVLPLPECRRLLALAAKDGLVGRLAVSTDQAPEMIPVNFEIVEGQVVVRLGAGSFSRLAAGHLVAFEVDHVDPEDATAWSVLVRGLATLDELPGPSELAGGPRPLVPEPGAMLLVVRPDVVTGRRFALPATPDPLTDDDAPA